MGTRLEWAHGRLLHPGFRLPYSLVSRKLLAEAGRPATFTGAQGGQTVNLPSGPLNMRLGGWHLTNFDYAAFGGENVERVVPIKGAGRDYGSETPVVQFARTIRQREPDTAIAIFQRIENSLATLRIGGHKSCYAAIPEAQQTLA